MPLYRNPTIIDVAQAAGVSKSVVSRVLTGNGQVSAQSRRKVQQAIAKLGYSSNAAAQALALGRTRNIGLLVRRSTAPFYGRLMFNLQEHAARAGYRMIAVTGNLDNASESRALQTLLELRVDGLVIGSGNLPTEEFRVIAANLPTVVVGRPAEGSNADVVRIDAVCQAQEAARVLRANGHHRVGFIQVPDSLSAAPRNRALHSILAEAGFDLTVAEGGYDLHEAVLAVRALLAEEPRPTAIISLSADGAWAALREADVLGLSVPEQLSVLSLDQPDDGYAVTREITSIPQSSEELAAQAWALLSARLENPAREPREVLVFSPVHHGSTVGPAQS